MTDPKMPANDLMAIYYRRPLQIEILALLQRCPMTKKELAMMLPRSAQNLKTTLQILISKGEIIPTPSGKYEIYRKNPCN